MISLRHKGFWQPRRSRWSHWGVNLNTVLPWAKPWVGLGSSRAGMGARNSMCEGGYIPFLFPSPHSKAVSSWSGCSPRPYGITNYQGSVQQRRRLISAAAANFRKRYNWRGESMRELFCAKPAHLLLQNNERGHIFVVGISAGHHRSENLYFAAFGGKQLQKYEKYIYFKLSLVLFTDAHT